MTPGFGEIDPLVGGHEVLSDRHRDTRFGSERRIMGDDVQEVVLLFALAWHIKSPTMKWVIPAKPFGYDRAPR